LRLSILPKRALAALSFPAAVAAVAGMRDDSTTPTLGDSLR